MNHESIAAEADDIRRMNREYFERMADRPSTEFVPVRQKQAPEIRKEKAKSRTAAWRQQQDRLRRPEVRDIGMALVCALVTSDLSRLTRESDETTFISAALADLDARGFDREQTRTVLRRFRNRLVDPGDREGEESETTGPAIVPSSWSTESASPF